MQSYMDLRFRNFRHLALAGSITLFVLIVSGGIVRASGAGGACQDWPTCLGRWMPLAGGDVWLDYLHRLATILVAPFVIGGAAWSWLRMRSMHWVSRSFLAALALLIVQILLGAMLSAGWLGVDKSWLSALHLGLSLLTLGSIILAAVISYYRARVVTAVDRLAFHSSFGRLSLLTLVAIFLLLVSGAVVAGSQATVACQGWPLCLGGLARADIGVLINLAHRGVVALSAGLVMALFLSAWRTQRSQTAVLVSTTAATVLFFAQALMGIKLASALPAYLLVLHQATAVAVWAAMVVQVTAVGLADRSTADEKAEALDLSGRRRMLGDLLALTKPIVVALLLVTTFAGMVIGARAWPSLGLTFWTLLGGFMAAGGSGAINQYIDRFDDEKMQRTQKRPIPAGRLSPGEGLAFGVAMTLASFYVMVAFVNLIAALLSLAGIIYYVLLYSIFLKKATVQNIVIGGGAGAIPPLVGWAAATGGLNIPSLFLFALVFLWTPPHFWALALVRRNDYARAGVPMLPVVRGEKETRWQIFLYTLELVGLTLLLPFFGLGSSVYLIGAAVLGMWLLSAAYRVWKGEGNKVAWKMYRYSSMYLAFIFVVLMIDRLL